MPRRGSSRTYRCPPDHAHGKTTTCYGHGCGCDDCLTTHREKRRKESRDIAYGRKRGLVPAGPTIAKVKALQAAGWTLDQIAEAAGTRASQTKSLIYRPAVKVFPDTEAAYLAIRGVKPEKTGNGQVDATGTRRRLQALAWMGHPFHRIADGIGMTTWNTRCLATTARGCTAATRDAVAALYDQLWSQPVPDGFSKKRAQNAAIANGWVGPLAWDDHTIDNPKARPAIGPRKVA
ncbi:hypothetical protein [Microbacterium trichothecenolyticum]|uniref:Helix-turn-helix DNA binding domain protein n=1 Tax=Microbacterium trichothecenolyticum TaxID=69370 RepID=A0A0M2HME1_MICTR|nr:hypothetical protein [Microbacterium trichothecenolyticum]KJL45594.1 hypothetical protein RS82_00146 [Microbacterium trichothecenolyticum]